MTDFTPEREILELVDTAIEETIHIAKIGSIVGEANSEDYSENKADELSKFDIFEWIDSKSQQNVESDNRAVMILELKLLYSVPNVVSVGSDGIAKLQFSSPLITLEYEEIRRRFMWLYTSASASRRRGLTDTKTILNQEDHQNIR